MRASLFVPGMLLLAIPFSAHAEVVIHEVAWMGTAASANAEWMELSNTDAAAVSLVGWHLKASNGSPEIALAGSIAASGYFLLERSSDASVPGVTADQIYTGALTNSGTILTLTDANGNIVDQVTGGANWANIGGDNATKDTAQRTASGWETAAATPRLANAGVVTSTASEPVGIVSTSTPAVISSGSGSPEYLPIPSLRIITGDSRTVSSGADTAFTATVYDNRGNKRDDAIVTWSFGDGMQRVGASVFHAYYDSGDYIAVTHATTPDGGEAFAESIITVKDASIRITSVSPRGISLANDGTRALDLSLWRLSADGKEFKIPANTHILAGRTVLLSSRVTGLPEAGTVSLSYPSGEVAATYPTVVAEQPPAPVVSYKQVQKVEPITSTRTNVQSYEEAGLAPAPVSNKETGAGATSAVLNAPASGIFKSPWTLGLLGVMVTAASAFILL